MHCLQLNKSRQISSKSFRVFVDVAIAVSKQRKSIVTSDLSNMLPSWFDKWSLMVVAIPYVISSSNSRHIANKSAQLDFVYTSLRLQGLHVIL